MDEKKLEEEILAYLETHHTLSLATEGDGAPHAASLFYVNEGFRLYFVSSPKSRHGLNIGKNSKVSATINEDYALWQEIKGIQLEGEARPLGGLWETRRLSLLFIKKFPDVATFFTSPSRLGREVFTKIKEVKFYEIIPFRISFINNEKGFAHKETLELRKA